MPDDMPCEVGQRVLWWDDDTREGVVMDNADAWNVLVRWNDGTEGYYLLGELKEID